MFLYKGRLYANILLENKFIDILRKFD